MEERQDLISRQAAIDTERLDVQIRCEMCKNPMHTDRGCDGNCKYDEKLYEKIIQILNKRITPLPSAQPESTRTFVELVVEYSDPELCIYKEYKGKPYYSIKYIENGETYVGYGTYNPEVLSQYLKEYFISSAQPQDWMAQNKDRILQAGMEGREVEFRICGRLFAIREKAQ